MFSNDIRTVLEPWQEQENAARELERATKEQGKEAKPGYRAPWNQLSSFATAFFRQLAEHEKERHSGHSGSPISAAAGNPCWRRSVTS